MKLLLAAFVTASLPVFAAAARGVVPAAPRDEGGGASGGSASAVPATSEPDAVQLDDMTPEDAVKASNETSAAPPPPSPKDARKAIEAADSANARTPRP